jgi:anti-sigma factor RsiW
LSCQRALEINSYVDGELEQAQAALAQRHLDECEACNRNYRYYTALRSTIRNSSLYHRTPLELKMRVRSSSQTDAEKEAAKRLIGLPW